MSLADVTDKGSGLPGRWVFHGPEGSGKTTLGTMFPAPVFVQARGETGLETLIDEGRVKPTPHYPEIMSFSDTLAVLDDLATSQHDYKTLVLDTFNGFERLCHEEVCRRDYKNDMTEKGFLSYARGYETSLVDWRLFLSALDRLRESRRMAIVGFCHTKVSPFKNPTGPDYDRYRPDMHDKTWGLTHKWADAVLFINFETFTVEEDGKSKGRGGSQRIMYCERTAAYDAKNRHGLPAEIDLGSTPDEAWKAFCAARAAGRATVTAQESTDQE